jgi:putative transposase
MRTAQSLAIGPQLIDQLIEGRDARALFEREGILNGLRSVLRNRARDDRNSPATGTRRKAYESSSAPIASDDPRSSTEIQIARLRMRHPDIADRIAALHARGHTLSDIEGRLSAFLGEPISSAFIEATLEEMRLAALAWRDRPLETSYPVVVFERMRVKGGAANAQGRHCHFAIGFQAHGPKEVIGFWLETDEGDFWSSVLKTLKARGMDDALYFLGSDPALAIAQEHVFPATITIAHVGEFVRHSQDLATSKDRTAIAKALRAIHGALTEVEANAGLGQFEAGPLGQRYPAIGPIWRRHWGELVPFLDIAPEIRRVMTSTFAADGLRRGLKKSLRSHGRPISADDAAMLMYLVAREAQRCWKRPQREWHAAKTQLAVRFPERFA